MKLFHKIFLSFVVIFGITFQGAGYLLINFAYGNAIEQEKKIAFQDFQYNRYILQSILYSAPELFFEEGTKNADISNSFSVPVAVYGADGNYIFSNIAAQPGELDFAEADDDKISFQISEKNGRNYIFVCDYISQGENIMYLATQTDISPVIDAQKNMIDYFQRIYLVILCISFPMILLLTNQIVAPIKKVRKVARRIAGGKYTERISTKGKDEISELAYDFNSMAGQIEEKITELSEAARQKEDFAANFAHELKTPLTSVIGYADMLYQRDLPREAVKNAAGYILNEGMRLETLSLKLMDLFVMDKQDFTLEEMPVTDIFLNLMQGIEPVCQKHKVKLHMEIGNGTIRADYDLFKSMMLNLADNSVKADCKDIWISGKAEKGVYQICLKDNGKGIPPEELGRITEAFYMVDKSRSRKQHGAGLGMALVAKVAEIHGAQMAIESDGKTGTEIYLSLPEFSGGRKNDQ